MLKTSQRYSHLSQETLLAAVDAAANAAGTCWGAAQTVKTGENSVSAGAPADAALPLSDEALASVGLQRVTAFVRSAQSANALRKRRSREKADQQGLKQLNIQLPVEMHQAIKDIAREIQNTGDVSTALQNVLEKVGRPAVRATAVTLTHKLEQPRGWRRLLAKLLGLA